MFEKERPHLGKRLKPGLHVARVLVSGGQKKNISSIFPRISLFLKVFPQFLFIFFRILVVRVGSLPTREGPGYASGSNSTKDAANIIPIS